jgi:acetyltransferase-like isoleucine patch superfamily enzyme
MPQLTLRQILTWELIRWLVVPLSIVPGVAGIIIRYVVLRWLVKESRGFFRVLERVTIEYPEGLSLGRGVGLNLGCWINARGGVTIGDNVIMGPYCVIHSANHRLDQLNVPVQQQGFEEKPVRIGNNVWLGARVTVLPGVTIADNAVVGAGAVVTKDIPSNAIAFGNPAHVIRLRTDGTEREA